MTYAANIFILVYDFAAYKYRRYAPNISILSEKGKILKDFPNVTLLRLAIFQTVFWLFGYRLTLNVSQNMVLVPTHLYKITQKLFAALQEPIFLEYFFKVWMSHCYKSFVRKWYKITILIITFLFANRFKVWDMQNIQWEVSDYFEAYRPPPWLKWTCKVSKPVLNSVTYKFWKPCKTCLRFE